MDIWAAVIVIVATGWWLDSRLISIYREIRKLTQLQEDKEKVEYLNWERDYRKNHPEEFNEDGTLKEKQSS